MAKLTLQDVTGGSIATGINANSALIEAALENTLSRDGTTPNQMTAPIDMNSQNLSNVGALTVASIILAGVPLGTPTGIADNSDQTVLTLGEDESASFAGTGVFVGSVTAPTFVGNLTGNATGALNGVLGGTTPAAATVTTLTASGDVTVQGTFTSLGIDDNCTGERVEIFDTTIQLGSHLTASTYSITMDGATTSGSLTIAGGNDLQSGGNITMYGELHANSSDIVFNADTTNMLTLSGATSAATFAGDVTVQGAFTSIGIDDNSTVESVALLDTKMSLGQAATTYGLYRVDTASPLILSAGTGNISTGATIALYGSTSTVAHDFYIWANNQKVIDWDNSAGSLTTKTGTGASKTVCLTLDSNQDATFAGDVDVTGNLTTTGTVNGLKSKIIDIGDWNMDSTTTITVAHGLTVGDIRQVSAMIRDDNGTTLREFSAAWTAAQTGSSYVYIDSTNVWLNRAVGSAFDNTSYDATSYNRGWIIVYYV